MILKIEIQAILIIDKEELLINDHLLLVYILKYCVNLKFVLWNV